jgi:hypothetical protein
MKDMKEVVTARIEQKLKKGYNNAVEATTRLQEEGKIHKDFVFSTGAVRKGIDSVINFYPEASGKIGSTFIFPKNNPDPDFRGPKEFNIHKHAIGQIADKLGIPRTYLTNLIFGEEWQRTLAYNIMNTHNGWTARDKVLVRAVGSEVRGFLSDQYRRLDSRKIFGTHIDEVYNQGGQLSEGWMDDTRIMVETMFPEPIELETEKNGMIYLAFGTKLSTSDYGDGLLELRSFILQGICLNGMVRESVVKERHLGARLSLDMGLSDETYDLDSRTIASAVRDLTRNLYGHEVIKNRMLEVRKATDLTIDPSKELKNMVALQKLLKGEAESIGQILMSNRPEDGLQGDATLWKLTQGITAFANKEEVSERRRMELQEIAGDLFNRVKN